MTKQQTSLYRHFGAGGDLLYVGISLNAFFRLHQHNKGSRWMEKVASLTIENFPTREEALEAETIAIRMEKPKYNIIHNGKQARSAKEARSVTKRSPKIYNQPTVPLRTSNNLPPPPPGDRWLPTVTANSYVGFRTLPPPDATAIYYSNGKFRRGQKLYLKSTLDRKFLSLPKYVRNRLTVAV